MITFDPQNESADPDDGQEDHGFEMLGYVLIGSAIVLAFPIGLLIARIASCLP